MSELLHAGVLVTRRHPGYKDVPGVRYHYPKKIYPRALATLVGALVLTCEPRREGTSAFSAGGGRSAFTGLAFIAELSDDPGSAEHGFAELRTTDRDGHSQRASSRCSFSISSSRERISRTLRAHRVCMTNGNGRAEADAAHVRPVANSSRLSLRSTKGHTHRFLNGIVVTCSKVPRITSSCRCATSDVSG